MLAADKRGDSGLWVRRGALSPSSKRHPSLSANTADTLITQDNASACHTQVIIKLFSRRHTDKPIDFLSPSDNISHTPAVRSKHSETPRQMNLLFILCLVFRAERRAWYSSERRAWYSSEFLWFSKKEESALGRWRPPVEFRAFSHTSKGI